MKFRTIMLVFGLVGLCAACCLHVVSGCDRTRVTKQNVIDIELTYVNGTVDTLFSIYHQRVNIGYYVYVDTSGLPHIVNDDHVVKTSPLIITCIRRTYYDKSGKITLITHGKE